MKADLMNHLKPKLTVDEQIEHMQSRGIRFDLCSTEDAASYLLDKENYFRVAAFRKLFAVRQGGDYDGKYANLDFAYLIDLSRIDRALSRTVLPMALDIENAAKMKIISRVSEDPEEDGYSIVVDFISQMNETARRGFHRVLKIREHDEYCGALIRKYCSNMPVWVLLEVGSFGTLVDFYRFCAQRWSDKRMKDEYYRLKQVKAIRNSTAHSSCIINGFGHRDSTSVRLNPDVGKALTDMNIGKKARKARLRNPRMQQLVTLLYTYKEFVGDGSIQSNTNKNIASFFEQIDKEASFYKGNSLIRSSFEFLNRLFDNWF
jgi:abortive infection bacteriophage resistance protein